MNNMLSIHKVDQDEIIEILDQSKAVDSEWREAMANANIDYFKCFMKNHFLSWMFGEIGEDQVNQRSMSCYNTGR
jgi:hypothetical protein